MNEPVFRKIQALEGPSQAAKDRACAIARLCPPPTDLFAGTAEEASEPGTVVRMIWAARYPVIEVSLEGEDYLEIAVDGQMGSATVAMLVRSCAGDIPQR